MKIIYISNDGKQFDNERDCKDYEWKLNHPNLKDVHVFDENGKEFKDIFADDTYNYSTKVIVTSNKAVVDLQDLAKYTGYCCYEDINKVGEWVFDDNTHGFIMIKEN